MRCRLHIRIGVLLGVYVILKGAGVKHCFLTHHACCFTNSRSSSTHTCPSVAARISCTQMCSVAPSDLCEQQCVMACSHPVGQNSFTFASGCHQICQRRALCLTDVWQNHKNPWSDIKPYSIYHSTFRELAIDPTPTYLAHAHRTDQKRDLVFVVGDQEHTSEKLICAT